MRKKRQAYEVYKRYIRPMRTFTSGASEILMCMCAQNIYIHREGGLQREGEAWERIHGLFRGTGPRNPQLNLYPTTTRPMKHVRPLYSSTTNHRSFVRLLAVISPVNSARGSRASLLSPSLVYICIYNVCMYVDEYYEEFTWDILWILYDLYFF